MTLHTSIKADERAATLMAISRALNAAVSAAERLPDGQWAIGEALCAALDTVGGGAPEYTAFGDMRQDAEWWADLATPISWSWKSMRVLHCAE
ncbi:hypothetical protein [Tateyamaria sp.]|uniref:hypothetical protein n=1 Tax=Tateyamaria sp. TaxID=1929288 RepID=UPI003B20B719